MKVKLLEVRDEGTFIPMFCVDMNPDDDGPEGLPTPNEDQHYLLRRCGYPCDGRPNIAITPLDAGGRPMWNDPYAWDSRTFAVAHKYINDHWAELRDGDVVDVEFILGERLMPKTSERETVSI
jgi:hypothetical protein